MSKQNFRAMAPRSISWCAEKRIPHASCRCHFFPTAIAEQFDFWSMMMSDVRYTDQHEWVRIEGDAATVGITKYAADALGDVVFVELPDAGRKVGAGGEAAVVESVKAASEVYAPIGGT